MKFDLENHVSFVKNRKPKRKFDDYEEDSSYKNKKKKKKFTEERKVKREYEPD